MKTKNTAGPRSLTNRLLPALCVAALALFAVAPAANSQAVLAGWDFDPLTGGTGNWGPSPLSLTTTGANLTAVGLTRGTGIDTPAGSSAAANAWGGTGLNGQTSAAGAISVNDFVTFSLTANSTYEMSISSFSAYNIRRSATGATSGQWQYQIGSGSFADIGSTITWGTITTSAGNPQSSINLSGITALQSVAPSTTVTFRLALWGASGAAGTWYLNDPVGAAGNDFVVNGTVTDRYYYTANGTSLGGSGGTWDNTSSTWSVSQTTVAGRTWNSARTAVFTNSAASVTVGTVSAAAGINFATTGYELTGGTLTLSGANAAANTITTASGTTTISSTLAGSSGMTKSGAGALVLSGSTANTLTGSTIVNQGTLELNKTAGTTAVAGDVTVSTGATLLISANNQVADTSAVTLSGGTIKLGAGTTETFGALSLTSASVLDFNNGTGFNMSFGTYTPTALLTINNFVGLSTLTFGSDLTSTINNASLFSFANGFNSAIWDSGTSTFTITAVPEPSTYVAAAGLLGLMLWPVRRRLLRDAQSVLGLRAPMRDRLARKA